MSFSHWLQVENSLAELCMKEIAAPLIQEVISLQQILLQRNKAITG